MIGAIRFEPLLPIWLCALAGALLAWTIWRSRRAGGAAPAAMRAVAAVGLLGALAGPSRVTPHDGGSSSSALTLLIDASRSMAICDQPSAGGAIERIAAVRPWLDAGLLEPVGEQRSLRALAFDGSVRSPSTPLAEITPAGDTTDLAGALLHAVQTTPEGGHIVALTDGADSRRDSLAGAADLALARTVRISAVVVGGSDALRDASVSLRAREPFVYAGGTVALTADVRAQGIDGGAGRLRIVERAAGEPERIIDERTVGLTGLATVEVSVAPRPPRRGAIGPVEYHATLEAGPGDVNRSNNSSGVVVQVSDAPIRVLVLEARPSWETRFFLDALRADARVDVTSVGVAGGRDRVLISSIGPGATAPEQTPLDALERFDVVALGRGVERWLPGARAVELVRFVTEQGGGLIFLRGDPVDDDREARMSLEAISPVAWGRERLAGGRLFATIEGRAESPVREAVEATGDPFLEGLPGALATTLSDEERTLSAVWLRSEVAGADVADRAPAAIAHLRAGRGATLAVLTDGLWRWAFAPPSRDDARRAYAAFWAQAIRGLAGAGDLPPGAELTISASPADVSPDEPARLEVLARPGSVGESEIELEVVAPSGATSFITATRIAGADRWTAALSPDEDGAWRIVARVPSLDAEAETRLLVQRSDSELMASQADPESLRNLAESTGGALLPFDRPEALLSLPAGDSRPSGDTQRIEPLWRRSDLLGLIVLMLLGEWAWRRCRGGV